MDYEQLTVLSGNSGRAQRSRMIVSVASTSNERATLVIGRPGLPNLDVTLTVGGAVLFETPEGLFEVRALSINTIRVEVLLTRVVPTPGITAGFADQDVSNTRFSQEERRRIAASLDQIRDDISKRADLSEKQLEFLNRKLAEIAAASERLGRKDWLNYMLGGLSSIIFGAAFAPDAARDLMRTAGTAMSWLYGHGFLLLGP